MKIKVDEDLPQEAVELLRKAGHDAVTVTAQALTGEPDQRIWEHVQTEGRCPFTADKGFADVRSHPPGSHHGIVLFRLPMESRAGYLRLVGRLMALFDLDQAAGAIVVVSPHAIRVHKE